VTPVRRIARQFIKPLCFVLVAAQLLAGFPAVSAAQAPVAAGTHVPCDQMGSAPHDDGCPCCPDGADSMKDCLVMCTLAAAVTPSVVVISVTRAHAAVVIGFPDYLTTLSDPPLKPPPIA
jgi:hypothetical protein